MKRMSPVSDAYSLDTGVIHVSRSLSGYRHFVYVYLVGYPRWLREMWCPGNKDVALI
jgi:hypothetical protein